MRKALGDIGRTILGLYLFTYMVFVPYYNWAYVRDHGFISWIFLGEFVATGKALVWPYFALSGGSQPTWASEQKENAKHILAAWEASQEATRLSNQGPAYSVMRQSTVKLMLQHYRTALLHALMVRDDVLEKAYPGLRKPFREKFQRSLQLRIRALGGRHFSGVCWIKTPR